MDARKKNVLLAVVEAYIQTGAGRVENDFSAAANSCIRRNRAE